MKLGAAVREPGVLFVALSRVRHPDDLMLDDDFPALFEILKQTKHPSFEKRQAWEKRMRVKFARTLRMHMRDADLYSHPGTHVWTEADSVIADHLLRVIRRHPTLFDEAEILAEVSTLDPALDGTDCSRVWARMQTFPYLFEVAEARKTLETLTLQGAPLPGGLPSQPQPTLVTRIQHLGWRVVLKDFTEFRLRDKLSPALFEHFAQLFRESAPPYLALSIQALAKKTEL